MFSWSSLVSFTILASTTVFSLVIFLATTTTTTITTDAALLTNYLADAIDNRPEGRYRFSMFCFQWQLEYYGWLEPAVAILGGTSTADTFSADLHLYLPERNVWYEQSDNRVSFDPRHSMVTQPVYPINYTNAELLSLGGFQRNTDDGTTIVDRAVLKYMAPQDPDFPEDFSWNEPWVDTYAGSPGPRARAASFSIGASMYVYGGITSDGVIKGDLWKFTAFDGWYEWESMYAPVEKEDSSASQYAYSYSSGPGGSAAGGDDYGGGSFSGYTAPDYGSYYANSASSAYGTGSTNSASNYYYYSSAGSSFSSTSSTPPSSNGSGNESGNATTTVGRYAAVQDKKIRTSSTGKSVNAHHYRDDEGNNDDDELAFYEREYEKNFKSAHSRLRRRHHHDHRHDRTDGTKKKSSPSSSAPPSSDDARENRGAHVQSASASLAGLSDKDLFRYGACCAALGPADGFDASPGAGSGTDQYALCFGGTGNTGDFRSVLKYKSTEYWWDELNIANPNDGPKPVRDAACSYNHVEQVFVVFGGYDSRTGSATTDTKIYYLNISDLVGTGAATWNSTQPQKGFTPIYGHSMCTTPINGKTYMYGGKSVFATNATLFEVDFTGGASNASFKQVLAPLVTLPAERAYHIAAATGTAFYVGFGRRSDKMYQDFWKFDLFTDSWSSVTQAEIPARWGASSAVFGGVIFIFGGRSALSGTVCYANLIAYESAKEKFSVIQATANAPTARAFHVSFVSSDDSVVVGLGQDNNGLLLGDWYAFSPVAQAWRVLTLEGDAISARIGASTLQSYNQTHSLVGLGYNDVGLNDWYYVTVKGSKLRSKRIPIQDGNLNSRITRRSFASVAGRGRHVLVCGGMQTSQLAAPPDARCYQIDAATGDIGLTGNSTAPVGVVAAPSVYVRDSIFTFGGQVISDPVVSNVFYKRMVRVRPNATCNVSTAPGTVPDDTDCSLCGFGSSGVGCQFTSPGSYTTIGGDTRPCSEGTFSTIRGGASSTVCIPCPFGTMSNASGLAKCYDCPSRTFCPVGSTGPSSLTSARANLLISALPASGIISERNPGAFQSPSLPWFPVGVVGGFSILVALLVATVLLINLKFYNRRVEYYFPLDVSAKLDKIFVTYATHGRDMTLSQMILVCNALSFDISPTLLQRAFQDQVDDTGRVALSKSDFKKAFMDLIRVGVLPPFKDSEAAVKGVEPSFCFSSLGGIKLSAFDSFRAAHIPPELGEPRRVIQTNFGGVLTLLLFVAQIIVILAILVDFLYSNITETKAIVPYPVVQAAFKDSVGDAKSDFTIRVAITGPIRESSRYNPSDDVVTKAEKICLDITTRACNNETRVAATGVTIPFPWNERIDCEFNRNTRQCFVTWYCTNCTIISKAELLFTFSSAQSANRVDSFITTTTGIRDPLQSWTGEFQVAGGAMLNSSIHSAVTPVNPLLVFSGYPATTFHYGLSPTYFESVELVHVVIPSKNPVLQSGYHLRPDANPTRGNSITPEFFGTYYDAPVKIALTTDAEIMYVHRQFVQTIIDLISGLLGAVSGVGGAFLAATNFIDERQDNPITLDERGEEVEKDKDELEAEEEQEQQNKSALRRHREDDDDDDDDDDDNNNNNINADGGNNLDQHQSPHHASPKAKRRMMRLPGQQSGVFELVREASMSESEAEIRRVLPLVTLGMSVDLALKYQQIMKITKESIPLSSLEKYDLEEIRRIVREQKAPITLEGVQEVEVDEAALQEGGADVAGKGKNNNMNKYITEKDAGDADGIYQTPQVIHVESRADEA